MPHDTNENLSGNAVVGMDQNVPDVRHGTPWDLGVGDAKRIIEPACRFANDFQVAADCVMDHWNARPRRFDTAHVIENPLATLANVDQVQARVFADIVSESYRFSEDSIADVRMNRAAFDHVDFGP